MSIRRLFSLLATVTACTGGTSDPANPNAGMFDDFLDGKFDAAGHPLNAKVIEAEDACGAERLAGPCEGDVPAGATTGTLTANTRLRVLAHATHPSAPIVTVALVDAAGATLASETLTVARLRDDDWIDLPVELERGGTAARFQITPAADAVVEVDYLEIFPRRFGLVVTPGSGVVGDGDLLTFELPRSHRLERLLADGEDVKGRLDQLIDTGLATRTSTEFRTLVTVAVGDLLPDRSDVVELAVRTGNDAARVQLRRTPPACEFAGDPFGTRVLVTGFQPFPADGTHDNVSAVAVTAMNPAALRGAQVMRMVLPVEYDRAAAAIGDVIERCSPDVVMSFGQGGSAIALEQTAYNLQDTGEISGGVPDNRGVIRAAVPIDADAPAERDTLLPLAAIRTALEAGGEAPQPSTDPGRYICNNVMFENIGRMSARGGRAGFIHLPFTVRFDDTVRARFARVVELAIQTTVDTK